MANITEIIKQDELWAYIECRMRDHLKDYMEPIAKADDDMVLLVTTDFDDVGILLSLEDAEEVIDTAVCHTREEVVEAYGNLIALMAA